MTANSPGLLLADRNAELFRSMGGGFRQKQEHFDPLELVVWFFVLVFAFVSLWLLSRYLARRERQRVYRSPRALFRALCAEHQLTHRQRRVIQQLAASAKLAFPAQAFLHPECFDASALAPASGVAPEELQALGEKLFGSPPAGSPA